LFFPFFPPNPSLLLSASSLLYLSKTHPLQPQLPSPPPFPFLLPPSLTTPMENDIITDLFQPEIGYHYQVQISGPRSDLHGVRVAFVEDKGYRFYDIIPYLEESGKFVPQEKTRLSDEEIFFSDQVYLVTPACYALMDSWPETVLPCHPADPHAEGGCDFIRGSVAFRQAILKAMKLPIPKSFCRRVKVPFSKEMFMELFYEFEPRGKSKVHRRSEALYTPDPNGDPLEEPLLHQVMQKERDCASLQARKRLSIKKSKPSRVSKGIRNKPRGSLLPTCSPRKNLLATFL